MQQHQDQLISTILGYDDKYDFLEKLKNPMTVETWDGKVRALISVEQVTDMYQEICFLGPLAAMYGREVQQILMSLEAPDKIPIEDFQYSVDMGRAPLRQETLKSSWQRDYTTEQPREDDRLSQASGRTRSPRATRYYADIREQPDYRQSTDKRERPDYRQSTDVRDRSDHRRSTDIRERRHHGHSESRYDRNTQERSHRR